jgi:hypothetical protein
VTAQDGRTTAATGNLGGRLFPPLPSIGGIAVGIPVQALNCNTLLNNVHLLSPQVGDNDVE